MQKYINSVSILTSGAAAPGASIQVLNYPALTVAIIYSDNVGTVTNNPLTADNFGNFGFYAANGRYQLTISGSTIVTQYVADILLQDLQDSKDVLNGVPGLTGYNIDIKNQVGSFTSYLTNTNTASRSYALPDASGTLISSSSFNAKGDIIAGTGSGTSSIKSVGTDGYSLIADSSQATGFNYGSRGGILSFSTAGATVADGLTRYIGLAFVSATEDLVYYRVPFVGVIKNMVTQCSATATGTRAYTLRKNSVDSTITSSCSGGTAQSSDLTHTLSILKGDLVSVKLVTSGGSDAVRHDITLEMIKTEA